MKVLLVEDDHFHARVVQDALQKEFQNLVLTRYRTEKEFCHGYDPESAFDVLIFDQMLPWTN